MRAVRLFAVLLFLFLISSVLWRSGTSFTVKSDGTGNFTTIAACEAAVAAGDTCTVFGTPSIANGTYNENPTLSTSGTGVLGVCTSCVTFTVNPGDTVTVQGFFLTGSYNVVKGFNITEPTFTVVHGCISFNSDTTGNQILNNTITQCGRAASAAVTSFTGSSGTLTFAAVNSFTVNQRLVLSGFTAPNTALNGQTILVSATGLSGTQFEAAVTGSGYSSGSGLAAQASSGFASITMQAGASHYATIAGNNISWCSALASQGNSTPGGNPHMAPGILPLGDHLFIHDNTITKCEEGLPIGGNSILWAMIHNTFSNVNLAVDAPGCITTPNNCNTHLDYMIATGSAASVTSFTGSSGTLTFAATNSFSANQLVPLSGFTAPNTALNGQIVTVLSAGLSGSQFEATVTGSGYSSGTGLAGGNTQILMEHNIALSLIGIQGEHFHFASSATDAINDFIQRFEQGWMGGNDFLGNNNGTSAPYAVRNWKEYNSTFIVASYEPGATTQLIAGCNPPTGGGTGGSLLMNIFYNVLTPAGVAGKPYYTWAGTCSSFVSGSNILFDTLCSPSTLANCTSGQAQTDPGNIWTDPRLIATDGSSFEVQFGSPALNAGINLTTVAAGDSGSGTSLVVNDATYFQDGMGMTGMGVNPDGISVTTVGNHVAITAVNYTTNTITLASGISRSVGDKIWLYSDAEGRVVLPPGGPNIGAGIGIPQPAPAPSMFAGTHLAGNGFRAFLKRGSQ